MKTKYRKELKTKTIGELETIVKDTRKKLLTLRFQASQAKLKQTHLIFEARKTIAVAKTFMKEKERYE